MNKIGIFLETALRKTFVSLYKNNDVLFTKYSILDFKSDNTFVYDIDLMLKKFKIVPNLINEIIVVNGPGYFTGIRSGIIIAKALFYVFELEVFLVDSFSFLRRCVDFKGDCAIVISASKKDCFIGYFKGLEKIKEEIISVNNLSEMYNKTICFTDSPSISDNYSIELIEPQPILSFEFNKVKTIDEISPIYMRSEESLFGSKR